MVGLIKYCGTFVVLVALAAFAIGFFFTSPVGAAASEPLRVVEVVGGEDAGHRGAFVTMADGKVWHTRLSIFQTAPAVGKVRQMIVYSRCVTVFNICTVTHAEITDASGNTYTAYAKN